MPADVWGIIPVRYASKRFPGKPLTPILGKAMFRWVYEQACRCPDIDRVLLATDDDRIADAARRHAIPCELTRDDHPSGTDRILEAALNAGIPETAVVVNIQGDEPALHPDMLTELIRPFDDPDVQATTLARREPPPAADNPDQVWVVVDRADNALYFSRACIPMDVTGTNAPGRRHIGLYAYRLPTLRAFVHLGPGRLERIERLEQLRLLENGIPIRTVLTRHRSQGVDRPADVDTVTRLLQERGH
ncbi:MAG: 3-deoxy-manno-octulosonate cytidylyltransferase [Desulfobacterales bacterium]|nr:3-deoxy-manno-octulosonate cytidylyltransferase [Desulfobacterales bacterium]MDJ0853659.1 3-deoxy-manno-octulosonate cytidylyltransferase [Desulfobacterales bacterium]MDJ0888087.1 3-deoxy-manno-octulosonate cytidylyltransferase [Desulfobacterales bacterium]